MPAQFGSIDGVAAWEVTDRVREGEDRPRNRPDGNPNQPQPDDAGTEAHLDELINEDSAATAARLEEEERARAAALATAPIRVASASKATAGRIAAGVAGATAAVAAVAGGAAAATGRLASSATASVRARRPGRRLGLAALAAVVVAAPAAGAPAPWSSLVGASISGIGSPTASGGVPGDLFSTKGLKTGDPLPTGSAAVPLDGSVPAGLDTTANLQLAGLPAGGTDRSIPSTVLLAYQKAAERMTLDQPGCQLTWPLLAGIGKVESNHARMWNGKETITSDGTVTPPILGPVLDGTLANTALLPDTDGGRLDGNKQFDRAVGPMQFVPGTWDLVGSDGNSDGRSDPNNVWDASLATARLLCSGNRDLGNPAQQAAAVFAYNGSADYVRTVLAWSVAYGTGADVDLSLPTGGFVLPPEITGGIPGTPGIDVPVTGSGSPYGGMPYADPEPQSGGAPVPGPTSQPTPRPTTQPSPRPSSPSPRPTPPQGGSTGQPTPPPTTKPTTPAGGGTPTTNPPPTTAPPTSAPFSLSLTSLSATRSKTADAYDRVTVTAIVDAKADGYSRLVLTLRGSGQGGADSFYVTGLAKPVQFTKGSNTVTFSIDGGRLGDSGVDGPYTASLTQRQTKADGTPIAPDATALGAAQPIGADWTAAEFADYRPSLQRIWNRVDEFHGLGQLDDATRTKLRADLQDPVLATALLTFRRDLAAADADAVSAEAKARLGSLADRVTPGSAGASPQPGGDAEPGPDPVRGPSS